MKFKKYNSIENVYRKEFVDRIAMATFENNDFVVQEKVHGANFSLISDGKIIKSAKRTTMLEDSETFYNHSLIKDMYTEKMLTLFGLVKNAFPETETITVFGELFGGSYPNVDQTNNAMKVQKGIFYAPFNDFYAFDILINQDKYVSVDQANIWFDNLDFFYARTLFRGTLYEALKYPNAFESKIPQWLKLPVIENNVCEGVVIKPVKAHFLPNGNRIILKNKNDKWSEKAKVKQSKPEKTLSKEANEMLKHLEAFVNTNRLNNVLSKTGSFDIKQMGKFIGLLSKDAFEDFLKEFKSEFNNLEKVEQKELTKRLNQYSVKLIKQELMQLHSTR